MHFGYEFSSDENGITFRKSYESTNAVTFNRPF